MVEGPALLLLVRAHGDAVWLGVAVGVGDIPIARVVLVLVVSRRGMRVFVDMVAVHIVRYG